MSFLRFLETLCDDFRGLSYFEQGVLLNLLKHMDKGWVGNRSKGFLPDNDKYMSRTLGISVLVWRRVRAKLLSNPVWLCCQNGQLFSPRLLMERHRASEISKIAFRAAACRWRKNGGSAELQDGRKPLVEEGREHRAQCGAHSEIDTYYLEDL